MTQSTSEEFGPEMARMYGEGMSIRAIGETTGKSYGYVHTALKEEGVTLRPRGGARKRTPAAAEADGN
jgi:transposase-like protein